MNTVKYQELFSDEKSKAKAFDLIAQNYYFGNFGTMQKSDFDVLMFSIYLERILEQSEEDMNAYSDYELSKLLGITQSRVSTLKVKKQLKYPYTGFDWKRSFQRVSKNARYENGKIKIHIPDKNLFLELQNAIEKEGGYVEIQLNSKLLQVSPEYFVDLMAAVSEEKDRKIIRKKLRDKLRAAENKKDIQYIEELTPEENLKNFLSAGAASLIPERL